MESKKKPFVTIQDRSNNEMFWVPRPTANGNMTCTAGFNVMKYLPFVDAVNNLKYASVNNISAVDNEMSIVLIQLTEDNCFSKFIEDIPELIFQHVEMAQPTEVVHQGKNKDSDGHN